MAKARPACSLPFPRVGRATWSSSTQPLGPLRDETCLASRSIVHTCVRIRFCQGSDAVTTLRILALTLTALVLVPSAAHLFELPGKIGLDRESYFIVQGIYAGWALFGVPIIAAILANGALAVALRRREPAAARYAIAGSGPDCGEPWRFLHLDLPANQATANWTQKPEQWEILRREWEYSHAANAIIVFAAFLATALAVVRR